MPPALTLITPFLWLAASWFILRRAKFSMERHLYPLFWACLLFLAVDLADSLRRFLAASTNPALFTLSSPFSAPWYIQEILLLVACILLIKWVAYYLHKQFHAQIFFILTTTSLVIFLVVTISFTGLLIRNIQQERFSQLNADTKLLRYAIDRQSAELEAVAKLAASTTELIAATFNRNRPLLLSLLKSQATSHSLASATVADTGFTIIAQAENPDSQGTPILADLFRARLKSGQSVVSPIVVPTGGSQLLFLQAAAPITSSASVSGYIVLRLPLDYAFLKSIASATGLSLSLFTNRQIITSTITDTTGQPTTSVRLPTTSIPWSGELDFSGLGYLTHIEELPDIDNNPIAHLAASVPNTSILETANRSLQVSYFLVAILLVSSLIPTHLISKFISSQMH
ncbi:hypothetical protein A2634_02715 [Candidatus Amesbacteria bacterium RIFCSPHIGHO2_01_FULL_48_32]|uniref:Double Cache domain-containing protein n=1 Tax=Candidatus Amesbacteria bacterium RIFCSPLOWO2_01_FULL_48_25 TaxID=1797259 RepID=A0A1F4ZFK6_9BACT|nr:MAG: hypothetical protein A2634_02715 [Candidatus Amesbacteria bacterium RIFCSPHIGHO2_01_FULL_48_32]OGD04224.1 MAG: hypothetical protein A2989_01970 [Candidatus Amesbacteria bacterium RIFCSPLOWO2_01_FULL_48_25]